MFVVCFFGKCVAAVCTGELLLNWVRAWNLLSTYSFLVVSALDAFGDVASGAQVEFEVLTWNQFKF